MRTIYLDYNATTPIAPPVQEAMLPFLTEHFGNPSSGHALGRACLEAVEDARGQVASLIGADAEEIVFTGCGSESNNLALKGLLLRGGRSGGGHLVISAIEHPSVVETARFVSISAITAPNTFFTLPMLQTSATPAGREDRKRFRVLNPSLLTSDIR